MIPKTISPTDLRKNLYAVVRDVAAGKAQYLVTPSEGESVVMCSRKAYDQVLDELDILRRIRAGEADFRAGRVVSHEEVVKQFAKLAKASLKKAAKSKR